MIFFASSQAYVSGAFGLGASYLKCINNKFNIKTNYHE